MSLWVVCRQRLFGRYSVFLFGCRPHFPINAVCFAICFLFILLCSEKNEPRSAAAVIGLFARTPTPRSGAAELAPLKQSSPFSLLGCRPCCPINAVCFAIWFLLLIKGRLLQCSEARFCPFFSTARRTNQEAPPRLSGYSLGRRRGVCFALRRNIFYL